MVAAKVVSATIRHDVAVTSQRATPVQLSDLIGTSGTDLSDDGAPIRVAYLGGIGRSGSTLVSRTLDRAPGVIAAGELTNLWHQSVLRDTPCGCGVPFSQCPYWQQVGELAFGGWANIDAAAIARLRTQVEFLKQFPLLLRPTLRPAFADKVEVYRTINRRLFAAMLRVADAQVLVDNSKHPSRALLLAGSPGVDVRVIHLVRASHGVSYSWAKRQTRADSQQQMLRMPVWRSAIRGEAFNEGFELLRRRGVPTVTVKYEDFVASPRDVTEQILRFLDVDPGAHGLSFIDGETVDLGKDHSVWGNPSRMQSGPTRVRADERWREDMSSRDRKLVNLLTWRGRRRYGYPAG